MAKVHIDKRVCKGCELCLYVCPKNVFEMSEKRNERGYNYSVAKRPEECILCKNCEMNCPDLAIYVEED